MNQALVAVLIAALVVLVIYRQMRTMPLQPRQMVLFPVLLVILAFSNFRSLSPHSVAAIMAFTASVIVALTFGVARGLTTQVWSAGSTVMRKGTTVTLALWIVSIAVRFGIAFAAGLSGVPLKATQAELPLFLAITLAAQNAVIWVRAQQTQPGKVPETSSWQSET